MSDAWINFAAIVLIQALLFVLIVRLEKERIAVPLLVKALLIGAVFGLSFDLVAGKLLGLHSYALGFDLPFLILNATLSYGLFSATMSLFQEARLTRLFAGSLLAAAVYETANQFFPVWNWEFSLPPALFVATLLIGYFGGAVFVVLLGKIVAERFGWESR